MTEILDVRQPQKGAGRDEKLFLFNLALNRGFNEEKRLYFTMLTKSLDDLEL